jgi:hypothetical protein
MRVGSFRGWMQVQPAADSWPGVTLSALAVTATAPAAANAAVKAIITVSLRPLMWSFMPSPFGFELTQRSKHPPGFVPSGITLRSAQIEGKP